jgi:hypothetical protein
MSAILEHASLADGLDIADAQCECLISIAISLKRIADNLDRDRHAVFTDHLGNPDGTIHTSVD